MLDNLTSLKICKGVGIMNHEGLSTRRRVAQTDLVILTDEKTDKTEACALFLRLTTLF